MRLAIHPVWNTTASPQTLRYGLYIIGTQGEKEIARADSMPTIEQLRIKMLACKDKK